MKLVLAAALALAQRALLMRHWQTLHEVLVEVQFVGCQ